MLPATSVWSRSGRPQLPNPRLAFLGGGEDDSPPSGLEWPAAKRPRLPSRPSVAFLPSPTGGAWRPPSAPFSARAPEAGDILGEAGESGLSASPETVLPSKGLPAKGHAVQADSGGKRSEGGKGSRAVERGCTGLPSWDGNASRAQVALEKGMMVIFDGGRRGWIDNAFEDLDGFWIRDEETLELVCEDDGNGETDIRNFRAMELMFIGEWSREMDTTEIVRVPPEAAVAGEHLEEQLLLMQGHCNVEMKLKMYPEEDGRWEIIVGPGQAPDVKAGCEAVSEFLAGFCAFVSDEACGESEAAVAVHGAEPVQGDFGERDDILADYHAGGESQAAAAVNGVQDGGETMAAGAESLPALQAAPRAQEAAAGYQTEGLAASKDLPPHARAQAQEGSVLDWAMKQDQFVHLPMLPIGWIRIKSSSGRIYYLNTETGATTFNEPPRLKLAASGVPASPPTPPLASNLPLGWEEKTSRSSGKAYFWNAELKVSQFDRPTP